MNAFSPTEFDLDPYSARIAHAYELVGPAVASIAARQRRLSTGQGSGVVFAPDGYLLTNSHVRRGRKISAVASERLENHGAHGRQTIPKPISRAADLGKRTRLRLEIRLVVEAPYPASSSSPLVIPSATDDGHRWHRRALGRTLQRAFRPVDRKRDPDRCAAQSGQFRRSVGRRPRQRIGINTAMAGAAQGICFAIGSDTAEDVATADARRARAARAARPRRSASVTLQSGSRAGPERASPNAVMVSVIAGNRRARAGLTAGDAAQNRRRNLKRR
jgi:hypothetical protein